MPASLSELPNELVARILLELIPISKPVFFGRYPTTTTNYSNYLSFASVNTNIRMAALSDSQLNYVIKKILPQFKFKSDEALWHGYTDNKIKLVNIIAAYSATIISPTEKRMVHIVSDDEDIEIDKDVKRVKTEAIKTKNPIMFFLLAKLYVERNGGIANSDILKEAHRHAQNAYKQGLVNALFLDAEIVFHLHTLHPDISESISKSILKELDVNFFAPVWYCAFTTDFIACKGFIELLKEQNIELNKLTWLSSDYFLAMAYGKYPLPTLKLLSKLNDRKELNLTHMPQFYSADRLNPLSVHALCCVNFDDTAIDLLRDIIGLFAKSDYQKLHKLIIHSCHNDDPMLTLNDFMFQKKTYQAKKGFNLEALVDLFCEQSLEIAESNNFLTKFDLCHWKGISRSLIDFFAENQDCLYFLEDVEGLVLVNKLFALIKNNNILRDILKQKMLEGYDNTISWLKSITFYDLTILLKFFNKHDIFNQWTGRELVEFLTGYSAQNDGNFNVSNEQSTWTFDRVSVKEDKIELLLQASFALKSSISYLELSSFIRLPLKSVNKFMKSANSKILYDELGFEEIRKLFSAGVELNIDFLSHIYDCTTEECQTILIKSAGDIHRVMLNILELLQTKIENYITREPPAEQPNAKRPRLS